MRNDLFCEISCVNMHLTVFTQILYLLSAKREKERAEKGKHDAYNIDHRFWPKSL